MYRFILNSLSKTNIYHFYLNMQAQNDMSFKRHKNDTLTLFLNDLCKIYSMQSLSFPDMFDIHGYSNI